MGLLGLFLLWLFGGFTAIPTLLLAVWWLSPEAQYLPDPKASSRHDQHPQGENVKSGVIKAGWITVRRTFEPLSESYAGFIASGYKSWMSKDPRRNRPKDQFFAMLKQTSSSVVLYLYDSDPAVLANNLHPDVWAAIDVSLFKPALYPADKDTPDAELFMKKTAVVLWPRASQRDNQPGEKETQIETQPAPAQGLTDSMEASRPLPWFLFPKTNFDKEDWYHTLLDVSRIGTSDATSSSSAACGLEAGLYHPDHMARLMASIDQKPEDLPIRGLNAMLGRLFLGVYQTQAVEDYIVGRIMRKLSKVQRPSFLSEIKVAQVNVGDSCPLFSAPLLKDLSPDGTASMTVGMRYKGECSVTVATVARITLQRIKTVDVALVLKVTLRRLEGQLMFMVKPPPSNRMWMGFTSMPEMSISVDPLVSTRQITWGPFLRIFESKIRELVAESIVAPHFDDITFSDSSHLPHRGGIFADAKRTDKPIDEVLAELLASLGPTPQAASAAAQREKNDEKAPVPENPTVSNEDTAKDIKAACDHCGQKMPDIRVEDANVVHAAHAESSKSEKPCEAKQHSKKNSWAWNGTRQFFNSSPALDSLTPASFKYQGPSISTSAPSSPVPPRNLPPPYERPQEPAPSSQQEDPDTSALGHLRGVLERDELSRPDSSPPGLQRRSSTSSRTSQMDSVGKESRSPSVRRNSLVEEPVDFTQSSSEDSDAAKSISSSHSESALDQATPTEERQLSLRPRSHTSSIRSSPRSFSPDPGPSSLPDHLSHIQPPPKRTVLPDPQSTTTFMETLKARANEKGFDIDHARDAMRSWSVKWGKKDNQPAESLASEVPSGQRDRAGSDSRPVVSNNGVSLASGQTTTSLSTTATSDQPTNVSPKASTSSLSPTETPSSTKPSTYKPAPTMSIPGIMNPAHRGGLGSDGPRTLVPQRPGDAPQPSQESRARLIPANFKMWGDKSKDQPPVATPSAPRRVPPPYVPKNPSAGSSEPALSSSQSLFEAPPGESADDGQEPKDVSTLPQVNTKLASPPETKSTGHDGTLEHLAPSEGRGRSLSAASSDADTEGWEFDD